MLIIISFDLPLNIAPKKDFNKLDIDIIEANKSDYIGHLTINKIDLDVGFYSKDNPLNNVDYGIEVLKPSIMPNNDDYILFLASHSGDSNISYFKNLYELRNDDDVIINYQNKEYKYKVVNKYVIEKKGFMSIKRLPKNSLILITCIKGTNNQLVIVCK
jgi:sortase A